MDKCRIFTLRTRMGNTKAAQKSRRRKLSEIEQLKQQVEDMKMKKIKMKKLIDFCTKKEHTQSIQLCNDLIKKIVQRGEQVLCSGHHLLTDSCPVCENCDLTIIRI